MKITKQQLKRIIKEELESLVKESRPSSEYHLTDRERAEKRADKEARAAARLPPHINRDAAEKATDLKVYDIGTLISMIEMVKFGAEVGVAKEAYNKMINLDLYLSLTDKEKARLFIKGD